MFSVEVAPVDVATVEVDVSGAGFGGIVPTGRTPTPVFAFGSGLERDSSISSIRFISSAVGGFEIPLGPLSRTKKNHPTMSTTIESRTMIVIL